MLKKFVEGLGFGTGFALAFIGIWYAAAFWITPRFVDSQIEHAVAVSPALTSDDSAEGIQFYDLEIDEQIRRASVIAVVEYKPGEDGEVLAVITEVLKLEPGTTFYYKVGDEYPNARYFPRDNTSYGDGVVVFFTDSPARMRVSMSYKGGRIGSLGDMPLKLLRKKCEETDA